MANCTSSLIIATAKHPNAAPLEKWGGQILKKSSTWNICKKKKERIMNTGVIYEVLDRASKGSVLTYIINEDDAGGLHMRIYKKTARRYSLIGLVTNILPRDIEGCVKSIDDFRLWNGLAPKKKMKELTKELNEKTRLVQYTSLEGDVCIRTTYRNRMGEAAREAFAWMDTHTHC